MCEPDNPFIAQVSFDHCAYNSNRKQSGITNLFLYSLFATLDLIASLEIQNSQEPQFRILLDLSHMQNCMSINIYDSLYKEWVHPKVISIIKIFCNSRIILELTTLSETKQRVLYHLLQLLKSNREDGYRHMVTCTLTPV